MCSLFIRKTIKFEYLLAFAIKINDDHVVWFGEKIWKLTDFETEIPLRCKFQILAKLRYVKYLSISSSILQVIGFFFPIELIFNRYIFYFIWNTGKVFYLFNDLSSSLILSIFLIFFRCVNFYPSLYPSKWILYL